MKKKIIIVAVMAVASYAVLLFFSYQHIYKKGYNDAFETIKKLSEQVNYGG